MRRRRHLGARWRGLLAGLLGLAASVHVAWFYVALVPSALNLLQYEQGQERTPFQQRLLMMFPLRWAHGSATLGRLAHRLSAMPAWFPYGVHAEGIVEAASSLACIVIAGLVAKAMYEAASPRKLLGPWVYPLTLVMIVATYCLNTMHRLRFVFDFPGMAFFSAGLYLIYFRRSRMLFAVLFIVATFNRETSLFLLLMYLLKSWADAGDGTVAGRLRTVLDLRNTVLVGGLGIFWMVWHVAVGRRFGANAVASGPRFWLNIGTLLWPTSWAQILCVFAFLGPLCMVDRKLVRDRTLRAWYWVFPVWLAFMMRFGILIEIRIFGELIPYVACLVALIAEEHLVQRFDLFHAEAP